MDVRRIPPSFATLGLILCTASGLHAQISGEAALATATAEAVEPGVRAALEDGQPVSFEHQSDWGQTVKTELEEALGLSLTAEHRRGASRILLGHPRLDEDRATVEVWFGRCERHAHTDVEILKIRMYSFTFEHEANEWSLMRASRLGSSEASCDGDMFDPGAVQALGLSRVHVDTGNASA